MADLLTKLGAAVLLHRGALEVLVRSAPYRYKVYQIEKRTPGQFRTIAQPAREVKALQYWVMANVLNRFATHQAATAYRKKTSILRNAKAHARGRFLLKMDFKDFFPSLTSADFVSFLEKRDAGFSDQEVDALSRILFWSPKGEAFRLCLSIGAPTSPLLSNILMYDFDTEMAALCAKIDVVYTRYADDLSFSSQATDNLRVAEEAVAAWCAKSLTPHLTINHDKTVRVSRADARRVTGLVLTNEGMVSLGRDMKRRIRAQVHQFSLGQLPVTDTARLSGMLAYVNSVEPSFLQRLRSKYGKEVIERCQTWRRS